MKGCSFNDVDIRGCTSSHVPLNNNQNGSGQFLLFQEKEYGEETTQKNFIGASSARVTFVAIADGIEVDVELLVADEEQAEPGVEGVHRHDEEDADDVALLVGDGVGAEVRVDLESKRGNGMDINKS